MNLLDLYPDFESFCKYVRLRYRVDFPTAKDIVQEAFLEGLRLYKNQTIEYPKALLKRIISRTAEAMLQSLSNEIKVTLQGKTETYLIDADLLLSLCNPRYKQYIYDFYVSNMSYSQLQQKYNEPLSTVKSKVRRGKISVRNNLQKTGCVVQLKNGVPEVNMATIGPKYREGEDGST